MFDRRWRESPDLLFPNKGLPQSDSPATVGSLTAANIVNCIKIKIPIVHSAIIVPLNLVIASY